MRHYNDANGAQSRFCIQIVPIRNLFLLIGVSTYTNRNSYTGSNFLKVARLLHLTHLKQSFRSHEESITIDATLQRRSYLGCLLPEAMLCILENYGPEEFTKNFLGNFETPEVIWKYDMRKYLIEQIKKHLNDFDLRLKENPTLVFTLL